MMDGSDDLDVKRRLEYFVCVSFRSGVPNYVYFSFNIEGELFKYIVRTVQENESTGL